MNNFFDIWQKNLDNFQNMFTSWQNMMDPNQLSKFFQHNQPIMEFMKGLSQNIPTGEISEFFKNQQREWDKKTLNMFRDIDKKALQALKNMNAENFSKSYQKWVENTMQMALKNPQECLNDWQVIVTEYLKDLEVISRKTKKVDFSKLMETMGKIASGQDKEKLEKYSKRFFDSLRVKLQYGSEYYADPTQVEIGITPKEEVWSKGKAKLFYYAADEANKKDAAPLLIVYSLINRPYILDLMPGYSVIEYFKKQGIDVYLIDWGEPDYDDRNLTLDEIISPLISECVDLMCARHKVEKVSMLGHCLGGVLGLLYAAVYPEKVDRFFALTTPITSKDGGIVGVWTSKVPIDDIIDTFGNMPAKVIRYTFLSLKPYLEVARLQKYYESLYSMHDEVERITFATDKWLNDNVDVPGAAFRKCINEVYCDDRFSKGQTTIHGKQADLKNITCPLLNIVVDGDWIVATKSSSILNDLVGSEEKYLKIVPGHHLSYIFDPQAKNLWDDTINFLQGKKLDY